MSELATGFRYLADLALEAERDGKHLCLVISTENPANGVPAWIGELCDHLYENCPALQRSTGGKPRQAVDLVDPEGGDICGWCLRIWRARNKVAKPEDGPVTLPVLSAPHHDEEQT